MHKLFGEKIKEKKPLIYGVASVGFGILSLNGIGLLPAVPYLDKALVGFDGIFDIVDGIGSGYKAVAYGSGSIFYGNKMIRYFRKRAERKREIEAEKRGCCVWCYQEKA